MESLPENTTKPVWCVVANVVLERTYGPSGPGHPVDVRRGSTHFAPGAKVFLVDIWGMSGGKRVQVVGRHRTSHRFMEAIMESNHLANWRSELAYSPFVVSHVLKHHRDHDAAPDSEEWRQLVEERAAGFQRWHSQTQPFTTRPPTT